MFINHFIYLECVEAKILHLMEVLYGFQFGPKNLPLTTTGTHVSQAISQKVSIFIIF